MPLPLPSTLTPSKISSFTSCALSFRFSVIDRLHEEPSPQAVKGALVHRALELLLSQCEPGHRGRAEAETALGRAWEELRHQDEVIELRLEEPERNAFLADASVLVGHYFDLEDPDEVTPVGVELDLQAEIDGIAFRGIIDRLDRMPDGGLAVVDYKTGRAPRVEQARSRLSALQLYARLCEVVLGERPSVLRLMYLRDRVVISAAATDQSLRGVELRARAVWAAIERACERSDFRPNPSVLCKWCSFQQYCPAFGGSPEKASPERTLGATGTIPA